MPAIKQLTEQLAVGNDLEPDQAILAAKELASSEVGLEEKKAFLIA